MAPPFAIFDQTKSAIRPSAIAAARLPGLPGFSRPLVGRSACTRAQSTDQCAGRHTFLSKTTHMDRRRHALQTHAQNASARTHDLCGHAADAIVWMPRYRRHTLVLETASRSTWIVHVHPPHSFRHMFSTCSPSPNGGRDWLQSMRLGTRRAHAHHGGARPPRARARGRRVHGQLPRHVAQLLEVVCVQLLRAGGAFGLRFPLVPAHDGVAPHSMLASCSSSSCPGTFSIELPASIRAPGCVWPHTHARLPRAHELCSLGSLPRL
jgi:hypothetical protein